MRIRAFEVTDADVNNVFFLENGATSHTAGEGYFT